MPEIQLTYINLNFILIIGGWETMILTRTKIKCEAHAIDSASALIHSARFAQVEIGGGGTTPPGPARVERPLLKSASICLAACLPSLIA